MRKEKMVLVSNQLMDAEDVELLESLFEDGYTFARRVAGSFLVFVERFWAQPEQAARWFTPEVLERLEKLAKGLKAKGRQGCDVAGYDLYYQVNPERVLGPTEYKLEKVERVQQMERSRLTEKEALRYANVVYPSKAQYPLLHRLLSRVMIFIDTKSNAGYDGTLYHVSVDIADATGGDLVPIKAYGYSVDEAFTALERRLKRGEVYVLEGREEYPYFRLGQSGLTWGTAYRPEKHPEMMYAETRVHESRTDSARGRIYPDKEKHPELFGLLSMFDVYAEYVARPGSGLYKEWYYKTGHRIYVSDGPFLREIVGEGATPDLAFEDLWAVLKRKRRIVFDSTYRRYATVENDTITFDRLQPYFDLN